VLESFVSKTRDKAAALKFIKKAMKRHGKPKAVTTDGLSSVHNHFNQDRHLGSVEIHRELITAAVR
jgi:putative transposase